MTSAIREFNENGPEMVNGQGLLAAKICDDSIVPIYDIQSLQLIEIIYLKK